MFNPIDIELIGTEQAKDELPPEFVEEFGNGKGDDEDECNSELHE